MRDRVIDAKKRFNGRRRKHPPVYRLYFFCMTNIPKQKLTKKLLRHLEAEPGPLDQVLVWCDANYGEFLDFVYKHRRDLVPEAMWPIFEMRKKTARRRNR